MCGVNDLPCQLSVFGMSLHPFGEHWQSVTRNTISTDVKHLKTLHFCSNEHIFQGLSSVNVGLQTRPRVRITILVRNLRKFTILTATIMNISVSSPFSTLLERRTRQGYFFFRIPFSSRVETPLKYFSFTCFNEVEP